MEEVENKTQDCGYFSLTIIALFIALFSAGLTLIIASHMYQESYEPITWPNEITASKANRLIVAHKKVILFKVQQKKRCYILPLTSLKNLNDGKFTVVNTPLSLETLTEVADKEGVEFCSTTPAFILDKVF